MELASRRSRKFRAELALEVPSWEREGLISSETASYLRTHYQLDETGAGIAAMGIYVLGALLVGGGVISLVAWNWASLSAFAKLAIITSALIGFEVAGYRLIVGGTHARLGHGLLL